jgi:hypothetical protein
MKVICLECHKQVGEKAPFSDREATHTLCASCLNNALERSRKKRRHQNEQHRDDSHDVIPKSDG